MKNVALFLLCISFVLFSGSCFAQSGLSVGGALDFWVSHTEKEITSAAAAMPEEKYSFAPVAGEFNGVRTFAQQVKHIAATNYRLAAYMLVQKPTPEQESEIGPDSIRSKAQILDYLAGSFAELHRAVASVNDGKRSSSNSRYCPAAYASSVCHRCGGPFVRSLWSDGGILANVRHCSAGKPSLNP